MVGQIKSKSCLKSICIPHRRPCYCIPQLSDSQPPATVSLCPWNSPTEEHKQAVGLEDSPEEPEADDTWGNVLGNVAIDGQHCILCMCD